MATQYQNLSDYDEQQMPDSHKVAEQRYGIAVSDWNKEITHALLHGALQTLVKNGVEPGKINVIHVPGTVELTYAAKQLVTDCYYLAEGVKVFRYAAVVALGCVIRGETPHFDYVCQSVTHGISQLNLLEEGCPVIFGVLTTENMQQARDRAGGKHGNKGCEAAVTAIKMANIIW
ncbi:MAG: 6,7-dimethyl-8-ribityllumazine synthase [Prevotellaceae bacterium]|jgi:6,7-dimethyl-8-ribityllumazine synthase|nr:6,7-dimethyl-8-ribityllumazine synthase [Prevotellaceae bacterium]